ncbi:MAG: SusC/RagA family TonB-linked outer membrane protein [Flavobacteriaceae bacterium]|nr:SusC/RagA family TonB-linked outer membrane protein [Flavobacteriaceae bacterium]
MRTKFAFLSALFLLFIGQVVFAQVTGTVQDSDGFPVADAEVTVMGSDASAITDENGSFSINAQVGDVLTITDIMGVPQDFSVTRNNMGVMRFGIERLDEVLITTGYDITTTKKETMGAVTTVSSETFENRATSSFLNSIQGHVPGVTIQSNSGSPGSAQIDVLIRGYGSINASTDPLIVVDGIVIGSAQFRNLNQQDFESVNVLRDAHATAIYGNRGANGVIVVTTKKGKSGVPLSIEFSSMYGVFTLPEHDYNLANAQQMLTLQNIKGVGYGATLTEDEIANWNGPNTDWRDVFFRQGISQNYNLAMRQGSENFRSYYSVGYNKVEGLIPTTDFQRFNARANIAGNSDNRRFNYEGIVSVAYSKRHELDSETNSGISNNVIQNPLFGSVLGMPYMAPFEGNGRDLWNTIGSTLSGGNYAYVLQSVMYPGEMPNRRTENSVLASFSASYELFDGLTARNKTGIDYKHAQRLFARAPYSFLALAVAVPAGLDYPGHEDHINTQDLTLSNVFSLNYDKTFGLHRLQLGAYAEYVKAHYRSESFRQNGLIERTWSFGSGNGWAPRDGDLYAPTVSAGKIDAGTFSYFGTLDYEYDQRYGVGASIRRDAASKFRTDQQWGTFWSAAARWVISEEAFLKGSKGVNLLKLRGSYGVTGNQILSQPGYDTNPMFLDTSLAWSANVVAPGYQNTSAYYPLLGNIAVGWEETHQANIGLDFIFFNNRLEGNIDVYQKNTKNLYTQIGLSAGVGALYDHDNNPSTPPITTYNIKGNNGELENKGIEALLRYKLINQKDFDLTIWANTAYNKNTIISIPNESINPGGASLAEGHMVWEQYLIPYVGVDQETGEWLYMDFEGNIVDHTGIDPERDSRWTGKSFLPKWNGGFGLSANYKGWYLDANFSYQADFYKFDNMLAWLQDHTGAVDMNLSADLLDAWTPDKPSATMASLTANNVYDWDSDRLLKDASFIRFRSATLGYNIPSRWLEGTSLKGVNLFVQGENLLIWTKWKGFDPEGVKTTSLGQYPNPRSFSFGVNVEF